jgi:hypothetical protein
MDTVDVGRHRVHSYQVDAIHEVVEIHKPKTAGENEAAFDDD